MAPRQFVQKTFRTIAKNPTFRTRTIGTKMKPDISLGEVKCKSLKILANFLLLMAILQDWGPRDPNSNLARFFSCIQILQDS